MPPLTPPSLGTPPALGLGEGVKAQARAKLGHATRLLVEALGQLREVKSDEAKAILSALRALAPVTPDVDEGVSRNELQSLLAGAETAVPGPGGRMPTMARPGGARPFLPPAPRPIAAAGMPFGGPPIPMPMGAGNVGNI